MPKASANKENQAPGTKPESDTVRWSTRDRMIMLEILQAEKAAGNQPDSGWKQEVWTKVAACLLKDGDKPDPPKTSKKCQDQFGKIKKDFGTIREMVGAGGGSASGFGWDDATKKVTATNTVWEAKIKAKEEYRKFRKNAFPHYDAMLDLVEGIMATGAGAFNPGISVPSSPAVPSSESSSPAADDGPTSDDVPAPSASRKRQHAPSDSPALGPKAKCLNSTTTVPVIMDYHTLAIERMEEDGLLSEDEMINALTVFDRDAACAKSFATIKSSSIRTSYVRKRIADTIS
ncbi:hypothetical protein DFP72DRAFT_1080453 [Ephemerocybe angulata]|uniref:Myb/SANT-like domain-containing protein n=1 Tax=Ephemerocybe angulata TaxID=980116 RepID=A0A8H6LV31_9AGAR|nr:hypothetical protein DFP72DRAFT_1080453 [Tulosesus angulatus]